MTDTVASSAEPLAWQNTALPASQRVDELLAAMTLEEKVAQLVGYWFDRRGAGEVVAPMQDTLGAGRPPFEVASRHGLGHFTRVIGTEPAPIAEAVERLKGRQRELVEGTRLGIPAIAHEECLTGVNALGATVYPAPISWGATFDPELVGRIGAAIGRDLRALGVHQGLSPVLDVVRDYRWGRVEETMGEDPSVVGTLGSAYVQGLEDAGVIATLKHFVGYSASVSGRNHAPVSAGPRLVGDVLLPPFEQAIRSTGVRSVMNSYSDIDGVPLAADPALLTTLLRDEWGFEGTVVSDYWSIPFLVTAHGTASDAAEAGRLALEAGLDVELPNGMCFPPLVDAVRDGLIDEALVDRAARRVLTQKQQLGLLDGHGAEQDGHAIDLDSPENRALAREAAEAAVVLLRNDAGLLPVRPDFTGTIAVVGPGAAEPRALLGCYSYPVHVLPRYPEFGLGLDVPSVLEAVTAEFPDAAIRHAVGASFFENESGLLPDAVAAAEGADLVVLVVGDLPGMFGRGTSGEGCDALDLALPGDQAELVSAVLALGRPTVLVTNSGRPYAFVHDVPTAVQTFIPGEEGASAIAGVLSGRVNPSGRLPVQIPRTTGGSQHLYLGAPLTRTIDRISNQSTDPAFPFGHGLSYTAFELSDVSSDSADLATDETARIRVRVRNTGSREGAQVVQLYVSDPVANVARPVQKLVGFSKVLLQPGESRLVEFTVHPDLSAYVDRDLTRVVDPGVLRFAVGSSSAEIAGEVEVVVSGARRTVGRERMIVAGSRIVAS